jgi:hypothetical protein
VLHSHAWDAFFIASSWRYNSKIPDKILDRLESLGALSPVDVAEARS